MLWKTACILLSVMSLLALPAPLMAQLEPLRLYCGVNQEIPVRVTVPTTVSGRAEVHLIAPATGRLITRSSIDTGTVDLGAIFPLLWTDRNPRVRYAQLVVDEQKIGPPLVIEPLVTPAKAEDRLTSILRAAALLDNATENVRSILSLPVSARQRLRDEIAMREPRERVYSGVRVWTLERIIFETTAGELELALRPDAAPRTAFHFLTLCKGGFYIGTTFHRVVKEDAQGNPFLIQGGDPTGTGVGGPGFSIEFEPSSLAHDFGVVSLARMPQDPNSGGSQFFICLSREGGRPLDGQYTAFAEVVGGATTIQTIAAVPVGPIDPADERSPRERPLEPPVITGIRVTSSTPARPERVEPEDLRPVRR